MVEKIFDELKRQQTNIESNFLNKLDFYDQKIESLMDVRSVELPKVQLIVQRCEVNSHKLTEFVINKGMKERNY